MNTESPDQEVVGETKPTAIALYNIAVLAEDVVRLWLSPVGNVTGQDDPSFGAPMTRLQQHLNDLYRQESVQTVAALRESVVRAVNSHDALVEALREILKGEGRFSLDHLEHAKNCIDNMKSIAAAALKSAGEEV